MTLQLVAHNPEVVRGSKAERLARKLKFADAELQRLLPQADDAEREKLILGLRGILQAAVGLLRAMEDIS